MSSLSFLAPSFIGLFVLGVATSITEGDSHPSSLGDYAAVAGTPLVLSPQRVAARGLSDEDWREVSSEINSRAPWPIGDWSLAELRPASGDLGLERVRGLVESLAARAPHGFASPVFVGTDGGPVIVTSVLLICVEPELRGASARALLGEFDDVTLLEEDWASMPGWYRVEVETANAFRVLDIAAELAARPGVRHAEPDWIFTGRGGHSPNDPSFNQQWALDNTGQTGGVADVDINAPEAWDITTGDAAIQVVVIDTGVQQDHPDITQLGGVDLTSDGPGNGGPVNSWDRHGTSVAGCVSATIDNSIGVVGSAPNCPSVSARTFITINGLGHWTSQASWTVDALTHAEVIGARVTNNSNYYGFTSSAIESKYQSTRSAGIVHFASAGNDSSSTVAYPALLGTVLAISSINSAGALSSFSNFGAEIAFAGPGTDVLTTDRTGTAGYSPSDYVNASGTSFASPYCAGVAALVISHTPSLNANAVEAVLGATAKDLGVAGWDTSFGWGLLDARAALDASNPCVTPATYCSSLPNSVAMSAHIGFSGTPSYAANDLVLSASQCPPGVFGLFFYGPSQTSVALGDGLLCVGGSVQRLSPLQTDSQGAASQALDFNSPPFDSGNGQVMSGSTVNFQFWYRDTAAGGAGSNLTDGLSVTICD
jgi:thermitase